MLCILYVNVVGVLLGVAALLVERVLPAAFPRRWLWGATIPISMVLPGVYRAQHNWSLMSTATHGGQPAMDHMAGGGWMAALGPSVWGRIEALDPTINRLWQIASWTLFAWGIANALRVLYVVHAARVAKGRSRGPAVLDGVPVVFTDTAGPATVGVWRPKVLMPSWVLAMPAVQRRYVVRHEEEHRRTHDARLLFVASLPLLLMPWNLALWWQLRRLCLAVELDCDTRVVAALGDARRYGTLLLRVAEAANRGPRLQPAFLGGTGTLERRLAELLAPTPLRRGQRFLLPALAALLLFIVAMMPHPIIRPDAHTHGATASAPVMSSPTRNSAR